MTLFNKSISNTKSLNFVTINTILTDKMKNSETERFGVSMPPDLLKKFDEKIEREMYTNRSEAIRDIIRKTLVEDKWEESDENVVGVLTLVYDHEKRGISDKLNDLQHEGLPNVISSMHVHLDEHNCLETIVIEGKSKEVREISDKLISTKGVKHGNLTKTSI